jgi:hypothetical protein
MRWFLRTIPWINTVYSKSLFKFEAGVAISEWHGFKAAREHTIILERERSDSYRLAAT